MILPQHTGNLLSQVLHAYSAHLSDERMKAQIESDLNDVDMMRQLESHINQIVKEQHKCRDIAARAEERKDINEQELQYVYGILNNTELEDILDKSTFYKVSKDAYNIKSYMDALKSIDKETGTGEQQDITNI